LGRSDRFDLNFLCFIDTSVLDVLRRPLEFTAYHFNRCFDLRTLVARLIVDVARCGPVEEKVVRVDAVLRHVTNQVGA